MGAPHSSTIASVQASLASTISRASGTAPAHRPHPLEIALAAELELEQRPPGRLGSAAIASGVPRPIV